MSKRPNILLILCDQLNASVIGAYGGDAMTPNLDRLASRGTVFTNATCPTPICSPSRASLETGRYPHAHGVVHNVNRRDYPRIPAPPTEEGIRADDLTLGRILNGAGYDTHHYGKWHLLDDDLDYYPDPYREHAEYAAEMRETFNAVRQRPRESWLDWYGWAMPIETSAYFRPALDQLGDRWDGLTHAEFIRKMGRLELAPEQTFDARVADKGVERLRSLSGAPFFLVCSFNYPHDPNVVPSPFCDLYDPSSLRLPSSFMSIETRFSAEWSRRIVADLGEVGAREFLRLYYSAVTFLDAQIGRLLDALDATGSADDTLVVFTSDHGDMAGQHGMVWKSTSAFYDGVMRVPLIARYPHRVRVGRIELEACITDVMPTILDFAGVRAPEGVQGTSLAPHLAPGAPVEAPPRYTFCERVRPHPKGRRVVEPGTPSAFAVRSRKWKYATYSNGDEYLYRLADDPNETRNLANDGHHTEQTALRDVLAEWLAWTGYPR